MSRKITFILGTGLALSLALTACAPETGPPSGSDSHPPSSSAPSSAPGGSETAPDADEEAATQEETCDWDSARIDSGPSDAPSSPGADIASVLIGSWQHTHINSGAGYEAVKPTTDIRYVFPSTTRLLYCQDVQGATTQAENAVDIQLNGAELVLPSPATGYEVTAWSNDTMVWVNHRDGSLYLLKRR